MITIYQKGTNDVRAIIDPDDQANQQVGIMRADLLSLTFARPVFIDFQVGDWCTFGGSKYKLNLPADYKENFKREYQYTLTMEGTQADIRAVDCLMLNGANQFTEARFSFTGKPIEFLNLIVANMQRVFPDDNWQIGQCIDADVQTITIDSQTCLQLLSTLATNFKTEYLIEGNVIYLVQKQLISGVVLQRGQDEALKNIERTNQNTTGAANMITRLYAYGSNKNIGSNYRNGAQYLRLGDVPYIEKNVDKYGLFEGIVFFDGQQQTPEIYPERTGAVTFAIDKFTFTDEDIDFDVNEYLIPGVTAQLTFNSGLLAGYTFDIHSFDFGSKQFVINVNTSSQTVTVPNDDLKPAAGDTYVLINILMPLSYVLDAEARLNTAAQQYFTINGAAKVQYTVECNGKWFRYTGTTLELGKVYNLVNTDTGLDVNIRLVSFTRNVRKPYLYSNPVFADTVPVLPPFIKLLNQI
jgi:hypothetical protein